MYTLWTFARRNLIAIFFYTAGVFDEHCLLILFKLSLTNPSTSQCWPTLVRNSCLAYRGSTGVFLATDSEARDLIWLYLIYVQKSNGCAI